MAPLAPEMPKTTSPIASIPYILIYALVCILRLDLLTDWNDYF